MDDEPILTHGFGSRVESGTERLVVVVGYLEEGIIDYYGNGSRSAADQ